MRFTRKDVLKVIERTGQRLGDTVSDGLAPASVLDESWLPSHSAVYRKAYRLLRDENRHQNHLVYDVDLSNVADDTDTGQLVNKMYYLIHHLDEQEQTMVALYLKYGTMLKMSKVMGVSYIKVARLMSRIFDKLVQLNAELGDDFDSDAMVDEDLTEEDKESDINYKIPIDDE